jgi:hypothetical protein
MGLCLAGAFSARAQMPGASDAGMTAVLTKLFGDIKAFTAKANVRLTDNSQNEVATMPLEFSFLDGNVRVDMDLTKAKSVNMPAGAGDTLKSMGMAQIASVFRPDKQQLLVMYPDQKMLMAMPLPKEQAAIKDAKLNKTKVGDETVDGHKCEKNKVLIPDGKGNNVEALMWNAADLKDFPVRIQVKEKENTSTINFSDVQFTKPEASKFDAPTGYTKYNNPQEMMQAVMSKMGGGEKK